MNIDQVKHNIKIDPKIKLIKVLGSDFSFPHTQGHIEFRYKDRYASVIERNYFDGIELRIINDEMVKITSMNRWILELKLTEEGMLGIFNIDGKMMRNMARRFITGGNEDNNMKGIFMSEFKTKNKV